MYLCSTSKQSHTVLTQTYHGDLPLWKLGQLSLYEGGTLGRSVPPTNLLQIHTYRTDMKWFHSHFSCVVMQHDLFRCLGQTLGGFLNGGAATARVAGWLFRSWVF